MKIRISHYGTSNIFQKQDGPKTYSSFKRKIGRGTTGKPGKEGSIKKPRKRDFDETHNSGLEKQSKAEVIYYKYVHYISLYDISIVNLKILAPKFTIGRL